MCIAHEVDASKPDATNVHWLLQIRGQETAVNRVRVRLAALPASQRPAVRHGVGQLGLARLEKRLAHRNVARRKPSGARPMRWMKKIKLLAQALIAQVL